MKRWWAGLLGCVLLAAGARAQEPTVAAITLDGRVTDATTGEPLPGVNVLLAYTLRGSTTDADGRYAIAAVAPGTYEVAVSMVGYETLTAQVDVRPTPARQTVHFELRPSVTPLDEVEVVAERERAWRRRYAQFERLFLGETQNAEHTVILNPEVLTFEVDRATRVLRATASRPLQIENRALGYHVAFALDRFEYDPQSEMLVYQGRPFFRELPALGRDEAARRAEAREQTWRGSLQHFLAAAAQGRAQEEGFILMRDLTREKTDIQTWEVDDNNAVDVQLLTDGDILRPLAAMNQHELSFDEWLRVRFQKSSRDRYRYRRDRSPDEQVSVMTMHVPWAVVYPDGYVFPTNTLTVEGAMGERRVADLLPREYALEQAGIGVAEAAEVVAEAVDDPAEAPEKRVVRTAPLRHTRLVTDEAVVRLGEADGEPVPPPADSTFARALARLQDGRPGRAADLLGDHLDAFPESHPARYLRAIALREHARALPYVPEGTRATADYSDRWTSAIDAFEALIAQDSSYRDVLYQYAVLWSEAGEPERAYWLGARQVALRPDLPHTLHGLAGLYRRFLYARDPKQAAEAFAAMEGPLPAFFHAEALRLDGQTAEAKAAFERMLEAEAPGVPVPLLLLSLARVYAADGDAEAGTHLVLDAIEHVRQPLDAWVLFDDAQYIATPDELGRFYELERPEEYRAFFRAFWAGRDPMPAAPVNERLAEHLRRWVTAERDYVFAGPRVATNSADPAGLLDPPPGYDRNVLFNDKGLVYLRFGEPDDRIAASTGYAEAGVFGGDLAPSDDMDAFTAKVDVTGQTPGEQAVHVPVEKRLDGPWRPNESWRYYTSAEPMDLHFVVEGGGNDWRLAPFLDNLAMVFSREVWGGLYADQARAARTFVTELARINDTRTATMLDEGAPDVAADLVPLERGLREQQTITEAIVQTSRDAVAQSLATDRHTWAEETEPLPVPFVAAAFRGPAGRTDLEIHYALPVGTLAEEAGPGADSLAVEIGFAVHDTAWQELASDVQTLRTAAGRPYDRAIASRIDLSLPPDSYHVAFHVRPEASRYVGGYTLDRALPDLSGGLALSDLLPAFRVEAPPVATDRDDLRVTANPYRRFERSEPVYVVFEVYDLAFDAEDLTRYSVAYTLESLDERGRVARLLRRGGDDLALAVRFDREATTSSPVEYSALDVADVPPGRYRLTVRVEDAVTGAAAERSLDIELYDEE